MGKKVIDITNDIKRAEAKKKWKQRFGKAKDWARENKQLLIVAVPAVVGTVGTGIKVLGKHHNLALEARNKDLRCYDTSLGHYWELRRKLTNKDWVQINRRRANGESLGDILEELKVLK